LVAGTWQDLESPQFVVEIEGRQILIAENERVQDAATVLGPIPEGLLTCRDGHETRLLIRRAGQHLEMFDLREARKRRLARLDSKPAALTLSLPLPDPLPLPEERILAIQREVRLRYQSDQSLFRQRVGGDEESRSWLKNSSQDSPFSRRAEVFDPLAVDRFGANTSYMRDLVQEIGWIDARRFGYPASSDAFFLVQHSRDLPLMFSVLPLIKKDVEAELMDGSAYALMFDRLQLALGRPQRFGSQVARSPAGELIVLPLEEPEGVDARRQQLGMSPLKEYIGVFGAPEVKLSTECSALTEQPDLRHKS